MVQLTALWLPILLSAVFIFLASFVTHMLLGFHRSDYKKLPGEDEILEAIRKGGAAPGNYAFPYAANPKEMKSPDMIEKCSRGPVGMMNVIPSGPPAMGKFLVQWFLFCVIAEIFVAYLASRTLAIGTPYLTVFRVTGTATFLVFAVGEATNAIWRGQSWAATIRHMIDGLIYALLVGGVFGWLWPA